jgi:hypothetical protein
LIRLPIILLFFSSTTVAFTDLNWRLSPDKRLILRLVAPIKTQFIRFFKVFRLYLRRLIVPLIKLPKLVFLFLCLFLLD